MVIPEVWGLISVHLEVKLVLFWQETPTSDRNDYFLSLVNTLLFLLLLLLLLHLIYGGNFSEGTSFNPSLTVMNLDSDFPC